MRDIKFRGKRLDGSGEWAYGHYAVMLQPGYQNKKGHYIISFDGNAQLHYLVDPETIGQFTGETDKVGKDIYEGDVIYSSFISDQKAGPVKWSNIHHAYIIDYPRRKGDHIDQWQQMHGKEHCYEVIGIIHDNPELVG